MSQRAGNEKVESLLVSLTPQMIMANSC